MSTFSWEEMKPFGVKIHGLNISEELDYSTVDQLRRLYDEHHLMVFHDQALTLEQQNRFAANFGPLCPPDGETNYISNIRKDGYLGNSELKFHSDISHCEFPIEGIMLHGIELDSGNTSTKFVSLVDAWSTLPDELKEQAFNRRAVHVFDHQSSEYAVNKDMPHWSHRIARPHPRTGEICLFAPLLATKVVEGLPEAEGRQLLQRLQNHMYRAEAIYEHVWHVGDVVFWDNLACNHARGPLDPNVPRTMQRATLGPLSMMQQNAHLAKQAKEAIARMIGQTVK
jgi:alpha-ketoglutarate-dependent taurine dioxygenase